MARSTVDFSTISRVLVVHLRHYGDVLLTSLHYFAANKQLFLRNFDFSPTQIPS